MPKPDQGIVCNPTVVEIWDHDDRLYEINSWYSLPDDAWQYELVELTEPPGRGACLAIVIPDATPAGAPFTPKHCGHALVAVAGGVTPWPILGRLIDLAESSGDIIDSDQARVTADDKIQSNNVWLYDGMRFEVNSFHLGDEDAWCYELYQAGPDRLRNDYVEVQIPDANPDGSPFIPEPADRVTLTAHGEWNIPWPVFRRFIDVVAASGDIVQGQATGRDGKSRAWASTTNPAGDAAARAYCEPR